MAYEPTNWKAGDVVTSAKLNKIEQGIVDGGSDMFIVTLTGAYDESTQSTAYSADKTFAEIDAAYSSGEPVYLKEVDPEDETYAMWFPPAECAAAGDAYIWRQISFNIPASSSMNGELFFTEFTFSASGDWEQKYGAYSVSPNG